MAAWFDALSWWQALLLWLAIQPVIWCFAIGAVTTAAMVYCEYEEWKWERRAGPARAQPGRGK